MANSITAYLYDNSGGKIMDAVYECGRFICNTHATALLCGDVYVNKPIDMHMGHGSWMRFTVVDADSRTALLQQVLPS